MIQKVRPIQAIVTLYTHAFSVDDAAKAGPFQGSFALQAYRRFIFIFWKVDKKYCVVLGFMPVQKVLSI